MREMKQLLKELSCAYKDSNVVRLTRAALAGKLYMYQHKHTGDARKRSEVTGSRRASIGLSWDMVSSLCLNWKSRSYMAMCPSRPIWISRSSPHNLNPQLHIPSSNTTTIDALPTHCQS